MNTLNGTQQFAGNNPLAVGTAGKPIRVFSVEVISGGTLSTVKLYNGTSAVAGNQYAQVGGVANKSVKVDYWMGKCFPNGCFLSTDANTAYATVVFTEDF